MIKSIEKHQIKISISVAVIVILFLIGIATQFATWKADMCAQHKEFDDRITHIGDKIVDMKADINMLKDKSTDREIDIAEIKVKLTNIEVLLIDLKQDIKDK